MSYNYDYKAGKKRVLNILNNTNDIKMVDIIPNDQEFTYDNGYYGWVSSIFVDIRDSTELFADNKKSTTARIIRSFSSEIIEILKSDDNLREIGIRGDCVYAIYATPKQQDIFNIAQNAFCILSFIKMLNQILSQKKLKPLNIGVGLSSNQDLVIKAGRNKSGISAKVWIGKAVTYASKLSNIANTDEYSNPILMTSCFYENMIDLLCKKNADENVKSWFESYNDDIIGKIYGCDIIVKDFNDWVDGGMKSD